MYVRAYEIRNCEEKTKKISFLKSCEDRNKLKLYMRYELRGPYREHEHLYANVRECRDMKTSQIHS